MCNVDVLVVIQELIVVLPALSVVKLTTTDRDARSVMHLVIS